MTGQPPITKNMRPLPILCEQERIPEPLTRQPQHKRRRGGEEQQEGYVMEIAVAYGSAVDKDVHAQLPEYFASDYIEIWCESAGYDDPGGVSACVLVPEHACYDCYGCGVDEVFE